MRGAEEVRGEEVRGAEEVRGEEVKERREERGQWRERRVNARRSEAWAHAWPSLQSVPGVTGAHFGSQHAHQLAALHREGLRHADDAVVAALGADHGDGDAGVARGRLDHRHARLELAALLGGVDDCESQAVLDRREWVEILALGVELDALRAQFVADLDNPVAAGGNMMRSQNIPAEVRV